MDEHLAMILIFIFWFASGASSDNLLASLHHILRCNKIDLLLIFYFPVLHRVLLLHVAGRSVCFRVTNINVLHN